jgi:hypothetical protein
MPETPDLQFQNCGSFATCMPTTDAGRDWLEDNIEPDQYPVCIEFRYLEDIVIGAREDGLVCHG